MDMVDNVARVLNEAHTVIASASDADLARPTPCANWTVSALIEHMIPGDIVTRWLATRPARKMAPMAVPASHQSRCW